MLLYGVEACAPPSWFQVEAQMMLRAAVHHGYHPAAVHHGYHPGHNPVDALCVSLRHCCAAERTYAVASASRLCYAKGIKPNHFKEPEASVLISSEETSRPLGLEPG